MTPREMTPREMTPREMTKAKYVFRVFAILFQPLYFLMLWMYYDQLQTEENTLARVLDISICALGVIFMVMQLVMLKFVGDTEKSQELKTFFVVGLAIWFLLEVVLSYWWCFVTGHDPLIEHTPFVVIFLGFNYAQYWALKKLGVLGA